MRILFLSDFHGHMPDLSDWSVDLIVAGGDYCEVDEIRRLKFEALSQGRTISDWRQLIDESSADALVDRALAEGSAVVAALAECGVPVFAIPGNSDRVGTFGPHLTDNHRPRPDDPAVTDRIINIENRLVERDGVLFGGLGGWSGPHDPQRQQSELERLGQDLARHADPAPPLVLVSHNVPYASDLDGVDNPDLPAFAQGRMVGSRRCLAVIETLQPVLCLSGHLHENYGRTQRIGATLCVCGAGAYRGDGVLLEVTADGQVSEPAFVTADRGARRVLTE
jgi:Icc-related predicted phosphoesterase